MVARLYCASTESRFIEEKNMINHYSYKIVLESYLYLFILNKRELILTKAVVLAIHI